MISTNYYICRMKTETIISIDTETGGLFASKNPLLQVGMGIYTFNPETLKASTVCEREWTLKPSQFPGTVVDPQALVVNKLDMAKLEADGLDTATVSEEIMKLISEQTTGWISILGQNFIFDQKFLRKYLTKEAFRTIDQYGKIELMNLTRAYNLMTMPEMAANPGRDLGSLCKRLNIANDAAHTALSDARATFQVYVAMLRNFRAAGHALQEVKLHAGPPLADLVKGL